MQQAIAIMDSGVGGLTVVKEVMRQLPQEKILYFGDTARTPYGPRNPEEVKAFTHQIAQFLQAYQPKMLVIACNTATAVALHEIRSKTSVPVIGVIYPGARAAIKKTTEKIVGVIGTEGTIRSGAYDSALKRICPGIKVISTACSDLVPLVERGNYSEAEAKEIVRTNLLPMISKPIDCLILGCTHYPFLEKQISEVMGKSVHLINSAGETAREMSAILQDKGQLAKAEILPHPQHAFFCSGEPAAFQTIAEPWLQTKVVVKQVSLSFANIS